MKTVKKITLLIVLFLSSLVQATLIREECEEFGEEDSSGSVIKIKEGWGNIKDHKEWLSQFWNYITKGHTKHHYEFKEQKKYNEFDGFDFERKNDDTAPVPEPCTLMLMGFGLFLFLFRRENNIVKQRNKS